MASVCIWRVSAGNALAADWFVATNGNDSADGITWATAKLTIQAGIDAAADSDTVWVSNGVYATGGRVAVGTWPNRVAIDKAITVQSINGSETTFIVGSGMRCVYVTNGATLSGFTLTNGSTASGCDQGATVDHNGGGAFCEDSGILTHCVLTGNWACKAGGGSYDGILNNCTLTWNGTWDAGGGSSGGTLNNCTLASNSASYGGGMSGGASINTIVYGNMATSSPNWNGGTFTNSCTVPDPGGTGNITVDPLFADATAGKYRLQSNSPCVDAGNNAFVQGTTDLDGNPRIANGTVDMGCYEYTRYTLSPPALDVPVAVAPGGIGVWRSTNDSMWVQGTKPTNTWVSVSSSSPDSYSTNHVFQESAGTSWSNLLQRNWEPPSEIKTWHFRCEPIAAHTPNSSATTLRGTAAGLCGEPEIWIVSSGSTIRQAHCSLSGSRNLQTVEHMWVSNQANGVVSFFDAPMLPSTNWTTPALSLAVGTNVLRVFGTNMLGDVAMAQREVFLECHVGSAGMGSNGAVRVEWTLSTDPSITNQWQRSTNLLSGAWTNFGAPFVATQEVEGLIESNFNGAPAFFRMMQINE